VWDNGHRLIIQINFMVKCVYMNFGSSGFMTRCNHSLMNGHYRTYIISSVGHPRLDSVMPLMLYTVVYNIWGTSVVLQISQNSNNSTENE
jgi:hypothetical protein